MNMHPADQLIIAWPLPNTDNKTLTWHVPEETPVALVYNGHNYAVMLCSPQDLDDFVYGFSWSEGIIRHPDDILSIQHFPNSVGIDLLIELTPDAASALQQRQSRRQLPANSGCGLCGLDNAEEFFTPLAPVAEQFRRLDPALVSRVLPHFHAAQSLRQLNRSVHGAAWINANAEIVCLREDVGRHNALDKLLGILARQPVDYSNGFVLISSRCSYEIVQKAARCGVQAIVSLSAPTAFALRQAREARLSLAVASDQGLISFIDPSERPPCSI